MNKKNLFILFLFLFKIFFVETNTLECGENQINNCKECDKNEGSDSCGICEPNYFPLLQNSVCISCNDPFNGQEGCKGECVFRNSTFSPYSFCTECEKGYYKDNGLCKKCSNWGCEECTYEKVGDSYQEVLKCQKCLSEGYILVDESQCQNCGLYCKKCHLLKGGNNEVECDECEDGYYLDSDKYCKNCDFKSISNGKCYYCASGKNPDYCLCSEGYVLVDNSCISCPNNCYKCEYNKDKNSKKCLKCNPGYMLDSDNKCIFSESQCQYYDIDGSNKENCLICQTNKYSQKENKCFDCPSGCSDCDYDKTMGKVICNKCDGNYILNPVTKECTYSCPENNDTGDGCYSCKYNLANKKYECTECNSNYAYINNKFQCLPSNNKDNNGLYNCITAEFIQSSGKYECLQCEYNYIVVKNDKSCLYKYELQFADGCLEAEKIENKYSCSKCDSNYAIIEDVSNNLKYCQNRRNNNLNFCLKGKSEKNGGYICTECVNNAKLEDNKCICNSDSFSKDKNWCYKCNDLKNGSPACDASAGCNYTSGYNSYNNHISCKKCGDGYYESSPNECVLCSTKINNCGKCHYKNDNNKTEELICDGCVSEFYVLNKEENKCQLNECDEYPDISPGCIICKDKLNEYKNNNKCQRCKYGYFKTKDEKCVFCSSEQNGGPGCYECGYETDEKGIETNKIICKECFSELSLNYISYDNYYYYPSYDHNLKSPYLSKDGKCYDCQIQFLGCKKCQLVNNGNGIENLKCISCQDNYYLTPEGNCVYISILVQKIPNCQKYKFSSGETKFELTDYGYEEYNVFSFNMYDYTDYNAVSNMIYTNGLGGFEKECLNCQTDYYLNDEGKCEKLDYDKCSFNNIFLNYYKLNEACYNFCYNNNMNVIITLKLNDYELYIYNFKYRSLTYLNSFIDYFKNDNKMKACLNNSGEGDENSPKDLKYCKYAYYYPENKTYACYDCLYGYKLNRTTHKCYESNSDSCTVGNIGTELVPKYSCIDDNYYYYGLYTLITNENKDIYFERNNYFLWDCIEAIENTTYIYSTYNCSKCSSDYVPYYSKFYDQIICQYINANITKEISYSEDDFNITNDKAKAVNGVCEKDNLFTPDGKFCYRCDDEKLNMAGCKGACNFSNKRDNAIKCVGECKTGYIEASEGLCSKCSKVNPGCHQCHYESKDKYSPDYKGIKRQRKFVCDYCEDGYMISLSGECKSCYDLGLYNCNQCEADTKNKDNYVCTKCQSDFFINENGRCEICDKFNFKGKEQKKCINCGNDSEGGIKNCLTCEIEDEKVLCKRCLPGYILLIDDNSCLEVVKNKELESFSNYEQLTKENEKYVVAKCVEPYTLVNKNNVKECIYIRPLYEENFESKYQNHYYFNNPGYIKYNEYYHNKNSDFIYQRNKNYEPCQEAENLGTEENPLYSCVKCYEPIGSEKIIESNSVKITEINSKLSYCLSPGISSNLNYCEEATYKINNGIDFYSCTKCQKHSVLIYDSNKGNSCSLITTCKVVFCKTCDNSDNFFCEVCNEGYEVNIVSGSCVKITPVIPSINWKDIYDLHSISQKTINGKLFRGPTIRIKGITSSQINDRHAFLIYFIFKKKNRLRNLEEGEDSVKMPGICQIETEVEEDKTKANIVEYECIGNQTTNINLLQYILDMLEEGDNGNLLKKSNLNELALEIKKKLNGLEKLENLTTSSFTLEDLLKIVTFTMTEDIKNINANDFKFNFKIDGKLDRNIATNEISLKTDFELAEVEDTKAACTFTIRPEANADLSCDLNVENHKDIRTFSFKTSEINTEDGKEIYLAKFNDIELINSELKDSKNTYIIYIIIGGCVLGAIIIGISIYCLVAKKKKVVEKVINNIQGISQKKMMPTSDNPSAFQQLGISSSTTRKKSKNIVKVALNKKNKSKIKTKIKNKKKKK